MEALVSNYLPQPVKVTAISQWKDETNNPVTLIYNIKIRGQMGLAMVFEHPAYLARGDTGDGEPGDFIFTKKSD
jgi:hypothetical protein